MLATLLGRLFGFGRARLPAALVLTLITCHGCRSSGPAAHEPARTAPPIVHAPANPPADPEPAQPRSAGSEPPRPAPPLVPAEPARTTIEAPERSRWYYAEQYEPGTQPDGFQATFDKVRNKIDVQTAGVTQFALDTSRIPIDWERLVILGIDGRNSELRRRDFDLLRFKRDQHGQWMVIEP